MFYSRMKSEVKLGRFHRLNPGPLFFIFLESWRPLCSFLRSGSSRWSGCGVARSSETGAIVIEHKVLVCHMNDHIHLAIMVHIAKRQCDWQLILPRSDQIGAGVVNGFGGVAAGKLDNDDLAMEIERNKMAGIGGTIVVPNHCIRLESAWIAINDVI